MNETRGGGGGLLIDVFFGSQVDGPIIGRAYKWAGRGEGGL